MDIKSARFKKRHLLFFLIPTLFVFLYWLKCQIGINYSNSFSISSYFPFKYLTNDVIKSPEPGIILEDNFEKKRFIRRWSNLWMQKNGTVTKKISLNGINGSKCLLIKNTGKGSWRYSQNKSIEVKKGDILYFEGFVSIKGDNLSAYLSVASLDKNKNLIDLNFIKEKVNKTGQWIRVEKQFNISDDNIRYICLWLSGVGKGDYRFDNIIFRKIE
jgi:hypothetical protein